MAEGQRTVRVRLVGHAKSLVAATVTAAGAVDSFRDKAAAGFSRVATAGAALAAKMSTVVTAVQAVAAIGPAIATAAGAMIALPAAGVAAAGVMAAVKLGADGAKRAFEGLKKTADPLRAAVSGAFEKSLTPAVANLNTILPKLKAPLSGIVTQLGGMATEATRVAAMPANMTVLNGVLTGTGGILGRLRGTVGPLTQAFIDLVSVAVPGFSNIGTGAQATAEKFAAWIRQMKESGELKARLDAGLTALRGFRAMLSDLAGIVTGVFRGITQGAGGVGGVIGPVLHQLNSFINSTQGQQVLAALGAALRQVGDAVSAVLGPALRAVAPLIGPLTGLFASVATTVSDTLVPAINFLAPGLAAIAGWIERNTSWLGPLAIAFGVVTGAAWLLNAALAANPIMLVVAAIGVLIAGLVSLWQRSESFRAFWVGIWNGVKLVVSSTVDFIKGAWSGLGQAWDATVGGIRRVAEGIGAGIRAAIDGAANAIKWVLNRVIDGANLVIRGLNYLPGVNIGLIPRLARGGFVAEGGMAWVGERGPELVTLPAGATVHSNRDSQAMTAGTPPEVRVYIGDRELRDLVRVELVDRSRQTRRRALSGAGGAQ